MSEIMEDTGTGIASALNWGMNCLVGAVTPYAIVALTQDDKYPERVGYVFIGCSVLSLFGTLFIYKFMKKRYYSYIKITMFEKQQNLLYATPWKRIKWRIQVISAYPVNFFSEIPVICSNIS